MDQISGVGPQVSSVIRYVDPHHASGIVYALNPLGCVAVFLAGGDPRPYTALNLSFDAGQKWYYFPRMQTDEAILFKLCDTDPSRTGPVPHAAFADPTSRPGAPPRVSFEVRTMAFFD